MAYPARLGCYSIDSTVSIEPNDETVAQCISYGNDVDVIRPTWRELNFSIVVLSHVVIKMKSIYK